MRAYRFSINASLFCILIMHVSIDSHRHRLGDMNQLQLLLECIYPRLFNGFFFYFACFVYICFVQRVIVINSPQNLAKQLEHNKIKLCLHMKYCVYILYVCVVILIFYSFKYICIKQTTKKRQLKQKRRN